jgi:selenocysteine-specific elongation factor
MAGEKGLAAPDLVRLVNLGGKELDKLLSELLSRQELVRFDKDSGRFIAAEVQAALMERARELLGRFHREQPLKPGMSREELKQRLGRNLDAKLFNHVLHKLTSAGVAAAEKDLLRLADHQVRLAADDKALRSRLEKAYADGWFTPPNLKDVLAGVDPKQGSEVLGVLVNEGVLIKIKQGMYYHAAALAEIRTSLVGYLEAHQRMGAPQFKEMTGLSRKYMIPLLEYFDSQQLTMRVGDERVLRKR